MRKQRRLSSAGDRWAVLILCALVLSGWGLAVGPGHTAWAAPGHSPAGQTVPTRPPTSVPPQPTSSSQDSRQESAPSPALTPASPSPTLTASATPIATTAVPSLIPTITRGLPTAAPAALAAPYQPEPTIAEPALESTLDDSALAVLPPPRACAPAVTSELRTALPPTYDQNSLSSLLWMLPLGLGMTLVGLGFVLIVRSGR